jgi:catechol 2,3-dioxygenase-like lactoylglutathione lyase family enzyme
MGAVLPRLGAVWLTVGDPSAFGAFARAVVGVDEWDADPGPLVARGRDWVGLQTGDCKLELVTSDAFARLTEVPGQSVLAFCVSDINAATERARAMGADVRGPVQAAWGSHIIVRAPDGVLFQLYSLSAAT